MILLRAAVVLVALTACGSGSAEKTGDNAPAPTRHYLVYEKVTGEKGIWIADADGSDPRLLVPGGSSPRLSPDGKWVVYAAPCDGSSSDCDNTYIVSTKHGAWPRALMAQVGWPAKWSSDSTRIVTTLSDAGDAADKLVTIDVASGKEATVARGDFWGWSISPDGKRIVFARAHGEAPDNVVFPIIDLYVTNLDGGGDPKQITNTGDSAYPVWGPKSIAFAKLIPLDPSRQIREFARNEIWRIQPDGSGRTTLSGPLPKRFEDWGWHCIGLEPSDWSADGSALLAMLDCEGIGLALAIEPQTGAMRSLGEATFAGGLARAGQFALVQWGDERVGRDREQVRIYPYAGGKPELVVHGALGPGWNR